MTHVLFISEYFNVAGTETFMLNVVRASDRTRFQYDFLIFRKCENKYVDEAKSLGCNIYTLTSRRESVIGYLKSLNIFFRKYAKHYNAVHWCGGAISSIAPLWFAYKSRIPVRICHSHNSSCSGIHTKIFHSVFKRFVPKLCTHLFACSTLASKFFFNSKSSIIIKNGIELDSYVYNNELRSVCRRNLGITNDEFVIGHIGRFTSVKNHSFLVDIAKRLEEEGFSCKLMLIGIGELMENIKQKVEKYGLKDKVMFLEERSDIPALLQAMDVFAMPSIYEGLPFVLVEAQAAGLPCLISDTINNDAIITPNVTKLPIDEGVELWCSQLKDKRYYKRQDTKKDLIEKGFSMAETVKNLEDVYLNGNIEKYENIACN